MATLRAVSRARITEFFTTRVFEATTEPDPAFNQLMMQDLHNTRQYLFRGFSGRHAASRLLASRAEWELRAIIADPQIDSAISGRARYLVRQQGEAANLEEIQ